MTREFVITAEWIVGPNVDAAMRSTATAVFPEDATLADVMAWACTGDRVTITRAQRPLEQTDD